MTWTPFAINYLVLRLSTRRLLVIGRVGDFKQNVQQLFICEYHRIYSLFSVETCCILWPSTIVTIRRRLSLN